MTVEETRVYMRALFQALSHVHSFYVIHRDIKPGNFLYNRKEKRLVCVCVCARVCVCVCESDPSLLEP